MSLSATTSKSTNSTPHSLAQMITAVRKSNWAGRDVGEYVNNHGVRQPTSVTHSLLTTGPGGVVSATPSGGIQLQVSWRPISLPVENGSGRASVVPRSSVRDKEAFTGSGEVLGS